GNDDSPRIIGETRKYIRDFERLAMQTTTARELYDQMLKLHPDWINRGTLDFSACRKNGILVPMKRRVYSFGTDKRKQRVSRYSSSRQHLESGAPLTQALHSRVC